MVRLCHYKQSAFSVALFSILLVFLLASCSTVTPSTDLRNKATSTPVVPPTEMLITEVVTVNVQQNIEEIPTETPTIATPKIENPSWVVSNDDGFDTQPQVIRPSFLVTNVPSITFSISDSHITTPADVLREVAFANSAGGGGHSFEYTSLGEVQIEWREGDLYIDSEDWQPAEQVQFTIKSPDGEVVLERWMETSDEGEIGVRYTPQIGTPPGQYVFLFESERKLVQQIVIVKAPVGPRLYYNDYSTDYATELMLYNFESNEYVRVFLYRPSGGGMSRMGVAWGIGVLAAWKEYQVNEDGQLIISLEPINFPYMKDYAVIGSQSGAAYPFPPVDNYGLIPSIQSPVSVKFQEITWEYTNIYDWQEQITSVDELWSLVEFQDLKQPGTQVYTTTINTNDQWRWGFSWCVKDMEREWEAFAMFNDSLKFFVDKIEILPDNPQFALYYEETSEGWLCHRWAAILSDWSANNAVKLEVRYTFEEDVFDGVETYPAGEYRQIIHVNVEECEVHP